MSITPSSCRTSVLSVFSALPMWHGYNPLQGAVSEVYGQLDTLKCYFVAIGERFFKKNTIFQKWQFLVGKCQDARKHWIFCRFDVSFSPLQVSFLAHKCPFFLAKTTFLGFSDTQKTQKVPKKSLLNLCISPFATPSNCISQDRHYSIQLSTFILSLIATPALPLLPH